MKRDSSRGFSLIELLAVLVVMAVMVSMIGPSLSSTSMGLNLSQAGQTVCDELTLARQMAGTLNKSVELRFIDDGTGVSGYRAIQLWGYNSQGEAARPLGNVEKLPNSVAVQTHLSPLLTGSGGGLSGEAEFGALGKRSYKAIRFTAGGRLELQNALGQSFVTVSPERDISSTPRNYYTIQINPLSGRIISYRP